MHEVFFIIEIKFISKLCFEIRDIYILKGFVGTCQRIPYEAYHSNEFFILLFYDSSQTVNVLEQLKSIFFIRYIGVIRCFTSGLCFSCHFGKFSLGWLLKCSKYTVCLLIFSFRTTKLLILFSNSLLKFPKNIQFFEPLH